MANSLEVLAEYRDALLLVEKAAWLHDFWKCTDEHVEHEASDRRRGQSHRGETAGTDEHVEHEASDRGEEITDASYRTRYLNLLDSHEIKLPGEPSIFLRTLIEEYMEIRNEEIVDRSKPWLARVLKLCHNIAHTEKEDVFYHVIKQSALNTRSSSSFGYESRPLRGLSPRLYHLPFDLITRNRSKFKEALEKAFRFPGADTRRPINEVTLWDWSSMVAALYKAALAKSVLKNGQEDPSQLQWKLLSVRLNGAGFSERVARIPDLLVRRKLIMDGLDNVCKLLEEKYPLGTEVYRDENGSVFIVPCMDELLDLKDGQKDSLSTLIVREFQAGTIEKDDSLQLDGEIIPSLEFKERECWFRKTEPYYTKPESYAHQPPLPIADHLKEVASYPVLDSMKYWWKDYREDICTVCQLRPQGWGAKDNYSHYNNRATGKKCPADCQTCKALERRLCSICERRREDRSKRWAIDERHTTIWIDEIADVNGRIALIAGKFDLEPWIDGKMLFYPAELTALQVRYLDTPPTAQVFRISGEGYIWNETHEALVSIGEVKKDRVPAQGQFFREAPQGETSQGVMNLVRTRNPRISFLEVERSFKVHSMVETQTPARLHRVWETTQQFWKETEWDFKTSVGEVSPRLRIRGTFKPRENAQTNLGDFHTYELRLGHVNLSVVYIGGGEFLTADNLERTSVLLNPLEKPHSYAGAAKRVFDRLMEENSKPEGIQIEEPTGYSRSNEQRGRLHIRGKPTLEEMLEETPYVPAIVILSEPQTFMAIVPANRAVEVAQSIREKYEIEMGKVRNRLPLTLGLVFAGSRTPLPAILNAGRRILKQPSESEDWRVEAVKEVVESPNPHLPNKVVVSLRKEQQSLSVEMRNVMGDETTGNIWRRLSPDYLFSDGSKPLEQLSDGTTEDIWYPYWWVKEDANGSKPVERERQFEDANGAIWVHVRRLRKDDVVSLIPSRFDFEFLETAAQRFEISYEGDERRSSVHPCRPYYLEELQAFEWLWEVLASPNGLTSTQIHNLIELIEDTRMEWAAQQDQGVFEQLVRNALDNAEWITHPKHYLSSDKLEQLRQAAISEQLADVVELYMRILKKKPVRDQEEEKK